MQVKSWQGSGVKFYSHLCGGVFERGKGVGGGVPVPSKRPFMETVNEKTVHPVFISESGAPGGAGGECKGAEGTGSRVYCLHAHQLPKPDPGLHVHP